MAQAKKPGLKKPTSAARVKQVPVRVLPSKRTPRVAPQAAPPIPAAGLFRRPEARSGKKSRPKDADRRTMMWVGVAVVAALIFVLWIGYMRQTLTTPQGDPQNFFGKIVNEVASVFKRFGKYKPAVNSQEQELNELRNRVFPQIDTNGNGYEFTTTHPANENVNAGSNATTTP